MNTSACIIAACAANARARKKEEPVHVSTDELYYKVNLRKYYYFRPAAITCPIETTNYPVLNDDIIPVTEITPVVLGAKTYAISSSFSVKESMCHNGIDKYIKNNLDKITLTDEWKARHAKVLEDYCSAVKQEYNIDLDPAYLNYTTEYYWEVK